MMLGSLSPLLSVLFLAERERERRRGGGKSRGHSALLCFSHRTVLSQLLCHLITRSSCMAENCGTCIEGRHVFVFCCGCMINRLLCHCYSCPDVVATSCTLEAGKSFAVLVGALKPFLQSMDNTAILSKILQ